MSQSIGQLSVLVRDYDEAIHFYVHQLGFTLVEDTAMPAQNKRWVVVAPPGEGGVRLRLPFDLAEGTALQRMVWLEIARIPYGETISYTQLAERVGFPRAVRAVASACGANPVPIIIPCHRVLAKDGTLGGFSLGGLKTKEYLLLVESQKEAVAA